MNISFLIVLYHVSPLLIAKEAIVHPYYGSLLPLGTFLYMYKGTGKYHGSPPTHKSTRLYPKTTLSSYARSLQTPCFKPDTAI